MFSTCLLRFNNLNVLHPNFDLFSSTHFYNSVVTILEFLTLISYHEKDIQSHFDTEEKLPQH